MGQSREEITIPIVEAVSDARETPIEELPPLTGSIDPDALETLVDDDRYQGLSVTFAYAGLRVVVHSGDTVYVGSLHDETADPRSSTYY